MRPYRVFFALTILLFGVGVNRAHADTIRVSFDLIASGFSDVFGSGFSAPVDPVMGSFSIIFDNSTDLREQSEGITVSGLNLAVDGPPGFAYGKVADGLIIGSLFNGAQTVGGGTNDFVFGINNISTNPTPAGDFAYAQRSLGTNFLSRNVTIELTQTATPEPATLALLGTGLTAAWLQRRRRA
jgi:hypothetical protein